MHTQYFVFVLVSLTAFVALFFLTQVPTVLFIFIVEGILVIGGVELLHRWMPQRLRDARSDNCVRMDGSFSQRRLERERRALAKVRTDLFAVFLLIVLTGNWLAFFLHYEVVPVHVAINAAGAFDVDPQSWKKNLRDNRIDKSFEEWSVGKGRANYQVVEAQQHLLWDAWPLVILVLVGWASGSVIFLSRAYLKIIRAYAAGVASRAEFNVNVDIARLQDACSNRSVTHPATGDPLGD